MGNLFAFTGRMTYIVGVLQNLMNFILKFYLYPRKEDKDIKLCQAARETCLDLLVYVPARHGVSF